MLGRSAWNRRGNAVLGFAAVLALVCLLANVGSAQAAAQDDKQAPVLPGRTVTATPGVSGLAPEGALPPASQGALLSSNQGMGMALQKPAAGKATQTVDGAQAADSLGCTPFITKRVLPNGFGGTRIDFLAEVYCNFYLSGAGQAYLIDRTQGSPSNGFPIHAGVPFFFSPGFYGYSEGVAVIDGRFFEGAREVEVVFDLVLQTLNGATWGGCFALPQGLRYEKPCSGLFTPTVSATVGTGTFASGLPPFNLATTIRDTPGIDLINFHVSGRSDPLSTARQNIVDAANGLPARTSWFSQVGTTNVNLDPALLRGMLRLFFEAGYTYRVTAIAGGLHGANSRHYLGKAVDVDMIAGFEVNASNPFFRDFMAACRAYGATEVFGPGDPDHDTHVHCAWPR